MCQPVARVADPVAHMWAPGGGTIVSGCPTVRIEGRPAARKGDRVKHNFVAVELIATGEPTVRIGGAERLAARTGDMVTCGGTIAMASPTVRIGMTAQGRCLQKASDAGTPYVQPAKVDSL